ncbi:hypothetical protein B296_00000715 [Ensete ventricosum]|uniref:Uncharacterized protein n=1 Tax=Ensete ventricosum TaxID=4639 RepID=A0A427AIG9_ENSVE|nr:hypothetical protein B296_00000715 [Ensete ventricosum]
MPARHHAGHPLQDAVALPTPALFARLLDTISPIKNRRSYSPTLLLPLSVSPSASGVYHTGQAEPHSPLHIIRPPRPNRLRRSSSSPADAGSAITVICILFLQSQVVGVCFLLLVSDLGAISVFRSSGGWDGFAREGVRFRLHLRSCGASRTADDATKIALVSTNSARAASGVGAGNRSGSGSAACLPAGPSLLCLCRGFSGFDCTQMTPCPAPRIQERPLPQEEEEEEEEEERDESPEGKAEGSQEKSGRVDRNAPASGKNCSSS